MHVIQLVAPIALIALCMVLGTVQHHWEKGTMPVPAWYTTMTPRQERILGWAIVIFGTLVGSGWAVWSALSGIPMP